MSRFVLNNKLSGKAHFELGNCQVYDKVPESSVLPILHEEGYRTLLEGLEESKRIRQDARNLMLLEWAKKLLMDETEGI